MPFQLSPVAILNSVRNAAPEFSKLACTPMPSQGLRDEHSATSYNRRVKKMLKYCMHCVKTVVSHRYTGLYVFMHELFETKIMV